MRRERETGFTLHELLVGVAVQVIVLLVVFSLMDQSVETYGTSSRLGRVQEEGRCALKALAGEMRPAEAADLLLTDENGSERVDFAVPTGVAGSDVLLSPTISHVAQPSSLDANGNGAFHFDEALGTLAAAGGLNPPLEILTVQEFRP